MAEPRTAHLRRRVHTLNSLRVVFSVLAVGLIVFGLFKMREASRARGWTIVSGTVVRSSVSEFAGKDGNTYRPMVVYSYSVGSIRFMSSRIAFHPLARPSRERAAELAAKYPVGSIVRVLYDPADPEQAVLELGISPWVPILAGGAFSMLAVWTRMLRGRADKQQARDR